LNRDIRWYQRKPTVIIAACVFALLFATWFWRNWVGLGIESQVRTNTTNAFKWALNTSAAESMSFQKVTSGDQTFYLPNYDSTDGAGIYNVQNLKSLFVYYLNQRPSMPMFRVESIQIVPHHYAIRCSHTICHVA